MAGIREVTRNLGDEVEEVAEVEEVITLTDLNPLSKEERLVRGILLRAEVLNVSQKGNANGDFAPFWSMTKRDKARSLERPYVLP